ncbi:AAA-like domain-containing protein [Oscillatoria sp. FACHB-1406]|uniref:AAA-like domain-containing protein n=1 Tax=Oscillatoria sp. FACHB-1406 TaxID=2692846 RepID=UPI001686E305|nr:AAA-like domain-containing protein [Oscillatoria sp. FACHB-1406]MBD2580066.1 AAA-like domain-containing protein [Oscillatoria sp. FACHB-1406]
MTYQYQVGGSLSIDAPSYVERQADRQLYTALRAGEFCYILNSRQMGKSSILVRTRHLLQEQGYRCSSLDMTRIGSENITPDRWYKGIVAELWRGFNLLGKVNLKTWWNDLTDISPLQRLGNFVEDVLLVQFPDEEIVIFIDEIDSIISLDFAIDDFFAWIRFCYNQRTLNPEYKRLTVAIFGVATPCDLIADKNRTPFNIGTAIELHGFTSKEALTLAAGLAKKIENPEAIVRAIVQWTGGQPFLTQKLCKLAVNLLETAGEMSGKTIPLGMENYWVESIVNEYVIEKWESKDEPEHLRTIRDRLLRNSQRAGRLLGIYQQILQGIKVSSDDSSEQIELILSGLVLKTKNVLTVRNKIYEQVFNLGWVEKQLKALRPYSQIFEAWLTVQQQDNSRLLRGQALIDAKNWAQGKSLSDLDYQFLARSEQLDRQETQQALEAARLQEVEARLLLQKRSARLQKYSIAALTAALMLTGTLGAIAFWQYRQALASERRARIGEIRALVSSSEGLFIANSRLDALIEALRARQKLLLLTRADPDIKNKVEIALQQAILGADEYNRFSKPMGGSIGLAIRGDGEIIAASGRENTVNLWAKDGRLLKMLSGHKALVGSLAIAQDGKTIVSGSGDRTVKVWNADGTLRHTLTGARANMGGVAIAPNSEYIAATSEDGMLRLWDKKGTLLKTIKANTVINSGVAFTPDSQNIVAGSGKGMLNIWNLNGQLLTAMKAHELAVLDVAINPNGDTIATASFDGTVKLWQFSPNGLKLLTTLNAHDGLVIGAAFSPDGTQLASISDDKTLKLWQRDGETWEKAQLLQTFAGHRALVTSVEFSPDGKSIATASLDATVKLWNPNNALLQSINDRKSSVFGVAFAPTYPGREQIFASASTDRTVKLWKRVDGGRPLLLQTLKHQGIVMGVAFSPDGRLVATASGDSTVKLWTLQGQLRSTLKGHEGGVRRVRFSPDGKLLASGSADGTVGLWNLEGKSPVLQARLKGHQGGVWMVSFSPDGQLLASASGDATARLWTKQGKLLRTFQGHDAIVRSLAFSPDGQTLATASQDKTLKLWRLDGSELATLEGLDSIMSVAFSPDRQLLASGSADGAIQFWKLEAGQKPSLLTTLKAHTGGVWEITFSPDGQTLASASGDNKVILWNVPEVQSVDRIVRYGCDWVRDYLRTNGDLEESDRHLCDR